MQPLAVVLIGLVDMTRKGLRQRVNRRDVIDVPALHKTRNTTPIVDQILPAERLKEI